MNYSDIKAGLLASLAVMFLSGTGSVALADDISGVDRILCATLQATRCTLGDKCESGLPQIWNIPDFIEIDLINKQLQTTKASGDNRVTSIQSLIQEDAQIFIQGIDRKRMFSIVVDEPSGNLSAAMASVRAVTSVFANCTPLSVGRKN